MSYLKLIFTAIALQAGHVTLNSAESKLTLLNSYGEEAHITLSDNDTFFDIIQTIESYCHEEDQPDPFTKDQTFAALEETQYDLSISKEGTIKVAAKRGRDYNAGISKSEKQDIQYIITTLSRDSLISIASSESSLKKAGDRIKNVHPFIFLKTVFTNEELKAGIHGIRDRGWIWRDFIDGLTKSLAEESAKKNLKDFIPDFSKSIKVDSSAITNFVQQQKWKELVNHLIDTIPRENNPNRYRY